MAQCPEQSRDGHVYHHQGGGQERHFTTQQSETRINVGREHIEEAVDHRDIIHGHAPPSAQVSKSSRCLSTRRRKPTAVCRPCPPPGIAGSLPGHARWRQPAGPTPGTRRDPASTAVAGTGWTAWPVTRADRKSTRLNSSHVKISYAVFCLKKKKKDGQHQSTQR